MERFTISISSRMKRQLEQMAKGNFRNLNGEINKALDDYIKQNGEGVVMDEPTDSSFEPQFKGIEPVRYQPTLPMHQNEPLITTIINHDEIEEF